MKTRSEF